ncbi:enoyl-CoA hydratase/isomerase family protein, partial [Acidisphaera sp. L21]|uniref:enoyl-CoA hydratase/isomerase family protein n=1 Tax=Acidisphaera sp. L21 TaxID=1641851 RepID=UPI00131B061E
MEEARPPLKAEVMEGIALVTFNTPAHNVATVALWQELAEVLGRYATDPAVRVLVLTGAGHHAFLTDPAPVEPDAQHAYDAAAQQGHAALAAFNKPVIARVRGDCVGGGLALLLHADVVVAAEDSSFAFPAARWGAAYPPDSVAALARLIGPQQAKRLLLSGARVDPPEALRIGLVSMVVADADLSETVVDLARAIADNGPLAVAAGKCMVNGMGDP